MAKYTELAEDILKHVGGKENVNSLKHCVTRLRFDLKDESKADDDYLKNRDGVVTVVKAGGQYQVVIGNHVPDVYAEVLQVGGLPAGGSLDLDEGDAPKGNLFDRFVSLVSSIFQPFLGPLAAAGIIKGIVAVMAACGLSAATSPMYVILNAAGDGFFQFFPIFRDAVVELAHSDVIPINKLQPVKWKIFLRDMFFAIGNFNTTGQRFDSSILHAVPSALRKQPP